MYLAVKYLHLACIAISGAGFILRGVLMMRGSPLLAARWMNILPHVVDTLLLASALVLVLLSAQYPFVAAWVTAKVFGLIGYIILGTLALKRAATRRGRIACWLAALAVFSWIVSVALTKNPAGYFA